MLKEIRFKDWKSFGEATLYIDPLTVLIGTNASGKSNALDGIDFLNRIIRGMELQTALIGDVGLPGIRGGKEWAALKPGTQFSLEATVQYSDKKDFRYSVSVNTSDFDVEHESLEEITNSHGTESVRSLYSSKLYQKSDTQKYYEVDFDDHGPSTFKLSKNFTSSVLSSLNIGIISSELHYAYIFVKKVLENIFILDPIPSLMRNYSTVSKTLARDASNLAGVLAGLPREDKERSERTLSKYITQLPERDIRKVWAEPVGRLNKDAMLYCEEEWTAGQPPTVVDAEGMSDGTLRFLGILTALLTRPEGSLIVIEEVDNGLHPSRSGLLLQMLREIGSQRNIDVLVTTHNPALLDALGPEMVPFVIVAHRDPHLGQSKLTLLEDIQNLPKLLASGPIGKVVTQGEIEKSLAQETGDDQ